MKKTSLIFALLGLCLIWPRSAYPQQDPPNVQCAVHEFWSGVELGWCASILHEGKTLETVQEINFWIQRMYHAAELMEGANALCSKMNQAWPNWRFLQDRLYRMCDEMIAICGGKDPNPWTDCPHLCESFWHELSGMMAGWSSALGEQMYDNPTRRDQISFGGCDIAYFKLGWRLGYAHFRLQAEDRNTADTHLRAALQHLEQLREARPASGYCVELWHPQLVIPDINKVLDRGAAQVTTRAAVDIIWHVITTIENTLNNGNLALGIRRAPGTADVLSNTGRTYFQGNSRGRRKTPPQITSIGSPIPPTTPPPQPSPAPALPPLTDNDVVGVWRWFNGGEAVINGDGTIVGRERGVVVNTGKWSVIDAAKRVVKITWSKGDWIDTLTVSADGKSLDGQNNRGNPVWARRVR